MHREAGLVEAIRATGGVSALARRLGIAQPTVSLWHRIPAERVLSVEAVTGLSRAILRPDLYPSTEAAAETIDEIDQARSDQYALLASLLLKPPDTAMLAWLSALGSDVETPLGKVHGAIADAARIAESHIVKREYEDLFIGVGRGELVPYASYYLTGFLNERPLANLRGDLIRLGIERAEDHFDPEDHLGTLCEIMSGFAGNRFIVSQSDEQDFFDRHVAPWAGRFFSNLENAEKAGFYRHVGTLGQLFIDIETEAFAMETRRSA